MSELVGFAPKLKLIALGLGVLLLPSLAAAQGAPEQDYQAAPQQAPQGGYAPPTYAQPNNNYSPQGYAQNNYPPPGYGAPPPNNYPPPGYGPPPSNYPPPGYGGYPPPRGYGYGRPVMYQPVIHFHDGLYLHMHLGAGFTSMSTSIAGDKYTFSGGSLSFGVSAGGAIAPNLILFGTFFVNSIQDPTYSSDGVDQGDQSGTTANLYSLGIGLAYYLMPLNVYFSGALTATWFEIDDSYSDANLFQTNTGLGFQLMVGKEWWVTQDWGLGVAAELTGASMKESNYSDARWSGGSFSILFSATYN